MVSNLVGVHSELNQLLRVVLPSSGRLINTFNAFQKHTARLRLKQRLVMT